MKGKKTGGRKKGSPNKTSLELKAMILAALAKAGGEDYLAEQAIETPASFLSLLGRVLPMQVAGDPDRPIVHRIERVIVDSKN